MDAPQSDLVVIGAGPGGYAAAFTAADKGLKVALVNAEPKPGGVCLQRGCIPSKALLHLAKLIHETKDASEWGLEYSAPKIDIERVRGWKQSILDRLAAGIEQLAKKRKVTIYQARARFTGSREVALEGIAGQEVPARLAFRHCIVATGSAPIAPESLQIDDPRVMDSTSALQLEQVPKSLLVVGGGYIGLELGQVYAALGSSVTVVELTGGLLPGADPDLVRPLQRRLKGQFKSIYLNTKVEGLDADKRGITARLSGKDVDSPQKFERVLISVGRAPNSSNLGLEKTPVQVSKRGFIQVDRKLRTTDPNILAIGDVAGEPMLAHKAAHEAKIAVEALMGEPAEFDKRAIPAVVFTDPEIAWCGLTETEAKSSGGDVKIQKFPWGASGRAMTLGRAEGLTKLIFDRRSERVLGAGICGVGAGELIAECVLAVEMGAVARDVADSIHPHPTLSEMIGESAEAFYGQAVHLYDPARK